ncbi:MAG: ATP synthase subunit C [Candidatus Omnitrophica bacterium]|nr:ATP synthase subunit C [Candidatus Omnitrophota bacterium]
MMKTFNEIFGRFLQTALIVFLMLAGCVWAQTATADPANAGKAFYAAALSTGIAALAAGIAVAYVGTAAVGALAEKPELTGRVLIFVGLAEGIAIYGLITAIMILGKVQ